MSPPFEAVIEGQRRKIEQLRAIRDELVTALRKIVRCSPSGSEADVIARAAIKKAKEL